MSGVHRHKNSKGAWVTGPPHDGDHTHDEDPRLATFEARIAALEAPVPPPDPDPIPDPGPGTVPVGGTGATRSAGATVSPEAGDTNPAASAARSASTTVARLLWRLPTTWPATTGVHLPTPAEGRPARPTCGPEPSRRESSARPRTAPTLGRLGRREPGC